MSADDFRDLTLEFDNSGEINLTFLRWDGETSRRNGIVQDGPGNFSPLVIVPPWVFVPAPPMQALTRFDQGDRESADCLLWADAFDAAGAPLNVLRTIDQVGHTRADRIVDDDTGLTYIVKVMKDFGRQARISGVLGILLDA